MTNSGDEQMAAKSGLNVVKNWSKDVQNLGENWSNTCCKIGQIYVRKKIGQIGQIVAIVATKLVKYMFENWSKFGWKLVNYFFENW